MDADHGADASLPALTGTPKQVAWAERIRAQALESADNAIPDLPEAAVAWAVQMFGMEDAEVRVVVAQAEEAAREALAQTSSAWWIEARFRADTVVRDAYRAKASALVRPRIDGNPDWPARLAGMFGGVPLSWLPPVREAGSLKEHDKYYPGSSMRPVGIGPRR